MDPWGIPRATNKHDAFADDWLVANIKRGTGATPLDRNREAVAMVGQSTGAKFVTR
jgi:hypothetical protein